MNAVIYARYSSHNQRDQSIEDQVFDCKKFAKEKGFNIVDIYADRAQSGRTDNRTEFQKMLKDSASKLFEVVLVWKLDRFGRNREETALNKIKLKKNGVRVVSVMENIPDSSEGVLLESVIEGMAEYYSRNLSENITRGMKSNARKAMVNGPLPIGYKNENGKIVIDEDKAEIPRKCFKLYSEGYTVREIVHYLNGLGFTSKKGKDISQTSVNKILKNKRYTGTYIHGGIEIKNAYEPIVSKELFNKVQQRFDSISPKHSGDVIYYFSNIIVCGVCGNSYTSDCGTSKNGSKYYYYKCKSRKRRTKVCSNSIIQKEEFEKIVFNIIFKKILNDSIIDELARRIVKYFENHQSTITPVLEKRKTELEYKISNLVRSIEAGVISDSIVSKINNYEEQLKKIDYKIERENNKSPIPSIDKVKRALENFKLSYMNELDLIRLVNNFVDKIIFNNGLTTIIFNYCFIDNDGNIYKGTTKCSTYDLMVEQSKQKLNTLIFHNNGFASYTFDYYLERKQVI